MTHELPNVIARHIDAVNACDLDALAATFADDALVNDNRREMRGAAAIRRWLAAEITGDRVTMDVRESFVQGGLVVVRAAYDGDFDRTKLPPGEIVLTNYFSVRGETIVGLIIVFNQPSPYGAAS